MTEDEMIGWHHQLKGHELDQTPGDVEGHGSLACSNSWGPKDLDKTQQLNNDNNIYLSIYLYLKESQIQAFQLSRSELLVLPSLCLIINILLIVVLMFLFKLMF